jgi:hypothetical protein
MFGRVLGGAVGCAVRDSTRELSPTIPRAMQSAVQIWLNVAAGIGKKSRALILEISFLAPRFQATKLQTSLIYSAPS